MLKMQDRDPDRLCGKVIKVINTRILVEIDWLRRYFIYDKEDRVIIRNYRNVLESDSKHRANTKKM